MDDMISRQAAIEALGKRWGRTLMYNGIGEDIFEECKSVISALPSAQPSLDEWCTDCKEYDAERNCCPRWNRVIRQTLKDAQPDITRCKDCKNWDTTWQNDWAKNYHYCPLIDGTRNGDWYCADAERRTDETTI